MSQSLLVTTCGISLLLGVILLLREDGSVDVESGPVLAASTGEPERNGSSPIHEAHREGLPHETTLAVVCTVDRRPVVAATVRRWEAGSPVAVMLTDGDGCVAMSVPRHGGHATEFSVEAPGYEPWREKIVVVDAARPVIELRGCGSISISSPHALPSGTKATAVPVLRSDESERRPVQARRLPDGTLRLSGLRPRGCYRVSVAGDSSRSATYPSVFAGWPLPTKLDLPGIASSAQAVLIRGIREADCPHLRVSVRTGGRECTGSTPLWDARRQAGVATPEWHASAKAAELVVRGPLGVVLARVGRVSTAGKAASVTLDLQRERISMTAPTGIALPEDGLLMWKNDDRFGFATEKTRGFLELFSTADAETSAADLRWGELRAHGVSLPRTEPIAFSRTLRGELRVLDCADASVRIVSHPRGEEQETDRDGQGLVRAILDAGRYRVLVGSAPVGSIQRVAPGRVTVVSLADLQVRGAIRVRLRPEAEQQAVGEEVTVSIAQANSHLRAMHKTAFLFGSTPPRIGGLPPGEVFVELRSATLGMARERVMVRAGETRDVAPSSWERPRKFVVHVEDASGDACVDVDVQVAVASQGRPSTVRTKTDARGDATVEITGGRKLLIGTRRGFWVRAIEPGQTSLRLVQDDLEGAPREVRVSGWWADKVRAVGVLCGGTSTRFVPGRRGPGDGVFTVPTCARYVLLARLRDGSTVFVSPPAGDQPIDLDAPPPEIRIDVNPPDRGPQPTTLLTRLCSVGGIDVRGTTFVDALGRAHAFGKILTLRQGAALGITVDAAAAHGGVVWRCKPVIFEPGRPTPKLTLEAIR